MKLVYSSDRRKVQPLRGNPRNLFKKQELRVARRVMACALRAGFEVTISNSIFDATSSATFTRSSARRAFNAVRIDPHSEFLILKSTDGYIMDGWVHLRYGCGPAVIYDLNLPSQCDWLLLSAFKLQSKLLNDCFAR